MTQETFLSEPRTGRPALWYLKVKQESYLPETSGRNYGSGRVFKRQPR